MADNNRPAQSCNADIRQLKRKQRRDLSAGQQQSHSQALCRHTITLDLYRSSQHIAFYIANDGEIDPQAILLHALSQAKQVYLPVLSAQENSLYFAPFEAGDQLLPNRFNIPEPVCQPASWKKASQLDLLFLPLVAFDRHGNRMGMGGGFYDRTLACRLSACRQHQATAQKPLLAGLAHEIQQVEQLQQQSWDIPLDVIITEKQLYSCR